MKVYIGPYKNWFGPYQLAELLCFWAKKEKDEYGIEREPDWVHNFGEWLAHGEIEKEDPKAITSWNKNRHNTWLYKLLLWIESKRKRIVYVKKKSSYVSNILILYSQIIYRWIFFANHPGLSSKLTVINNNS